MGSLLPPRRGRSVRTTINFRVCRAIGGFQTHMEFTSQKRGDLAGNQSDKIALLSGEVCCEGMRCQMAQSAKQSWLSSWTDSCPYFLVRTLTWRLTQGKWTDESNGPSWPLKIHEFTHADGLQGLILNSTLCKPCYLLKTGEVYLLIMACSDTQKVIEWNHGIIPCTQQMYSIVSTLKRTGPGCSKTDEANPRLVILTLVLLAPRSWTSPHCWTIFWKRHPHFKIFT